MKTTLDKTELIDLGACEDCLVTFVDAHGDKVVTLSQALDSNGWHDIWWYIDKAWNSLYSRQQKEIHLLGCDWAESCLDSFEKQFPDDKRPRLAIEAKRKFIRGEITLDDLTKAWSAARSAAWSAGESAWAAWSAAQSAAWSAAWAAWSAARSAAWAAAWAAESAIRQEKFNNDLKELFLKWEKECE